MNRVTLLLTLLILGGLQWQPTTEAQADVVNGKTCSFVRITTAGSSRGFWVHDTAFTPDDLCLQQTFFRDTSTMQSFTLICRETTAGILPPGEANSVTIQAFNDNDNFGSPAATPIWRRTFGNCSTPQSFVIYCSSDGTATGTPSYGFVRIVLRAQRTDLGTYDINSDNTGTLFGSGAYRCNPGLTSFTDGNPTTSPSIYIGGDTIRSSITVNATPYATSGTTVTFNYICATVTVADGSVLATTSVTSSDTTIKGAVTTWARTCTITQDAVMSRLSTIDGFTTFRYSVWNQVNPPAGVTFPDENTARRTAKNLDRNLVVVSPAVCTWHLTAGGQAITAANRGETIHSACQLQTARGNTIPNNALANLYTRRDSQAFASVGDVAVVATSFGPNGNLATNVPLGTTATDTNVTSDFYVRDIIQYGASRTVGEEYNYVTNITALEISAVYNLGILMNSRLSSPLVNASQFVVGSDQQFTKPMRLQGTRGASQLIQGATVSCFRTLPDSTTESSVNHGATDVNGDASTIQYSVVPPTGRWTTTCTTTHNGNSLNYNISYLFINPVSSDTDIIIQYKIYNLTERYFNVSAGGITWNQICNCLERAFTDDSDVRVYFKLLQTHDRSDVETPVRHVLMLPVSPTSSLYYANVSINNTAYDSGSIVVKMNMSGKTFVKSAAINFEIEGANMQSIPSELAIPSLIIFLMLATIYYALKPTIDPIAASAVSVFANLICWVLLLENQANMSVVVFGSLMLVLAGFLMFALFSLYKSFMAIKEPGDG